MENQLEKRYGLVTAICVVVGIVVGSGVFFKAEKILVCTDGRTSLGILAWLIGGIIMVWGNSQMQEHWCVTVFQ